MKSKQSEVVDKLLQGACDVRNLAEKMVDTDKLIAEKKRENARKYRIPVLFSRLLHPVRYVIDGAPCYEFGKGEKCVLYFHGGSYVDQPMLAHWAFLQKLTKEAGVKVVFPIYSKTPTSTCDVVVPQMESVYDAVLKKFSPENVVFMGDSAGGGLALALAELLAEKGKNLPNKLVLMSPWLDVTLENEQLDGSADVMLNPSDLLLYGKCYLGSHDKRYYLASPIYNVSDKLPEIYVFIGSAELFFADCLRFKSIADEAGAKVKLYEVPHMQHVFPLMPIPEAEEVRKQICLILN